MLCELCGKKVKTKKSIFNLFEPEIHHLCEMCYRKYPLNMKYQVIPIEHGQIHHYLMNAPIISSIAYMSFLKPYYQDYLLRYKNCIFLYFDEISDQDLIMMDYLKLGDLYVVSLYENIEKKEKNYEIRSRR
ncbi:MAG TPA: hypothetical protein DEG42_03980 [Acholeplasmataceae bacterium]|nr:MAG: hypothetical protein A2Y43_01990 [Tenericutes bacterium GWA2_38_26]OHE30398.1 MAG: hypothetical protein A2084_00430 [Tenericutes bacterium GWC2_39_45]OHE31418.1 MAG: hypothetical protein A2009_04935 [Tenericutes bacterium GWD2_38_27]HBG32412.1 hypothetical protein [Acholeplasmataceae bacterium]HBY65526.1 hypothetical protein [Acholeplasmataceae bacterium]